jgi:dolichol-phosphate mannosyltransferase
MSYGIVIPTYNEHASIAALLRDIRAHAPDSPICVVDDSPNTQTADAVGPFGNAGVRIIRRKAKGGRGTAVLDGIRDLLREDVESIVEMDADFSHPPTQVPALASRLQSEGLDLLIASRYLPESEIKNWPAGRRLFSYSANKVARVVLGVPVSDYTNGFRCYSRKAAELVVATCGHLGAGFIVLSEILVNLHYRGFRVGEVPTKFVNRVRGASSLNANEIAAAAYGLARIHKLKNELNGGRR